MPYKEYISYSRVNSIQQTTNHNTYTLASVDTLNRSNYYMIAFLIDAQYTKK